MFVRWSDVNIDIIMKILFIRKITFRNVTSLSISFKRTQYIKVIGGRERGRNLSLVISVTSIFKHEILTHTLNRGWVIGRWPSTSTSVFRRVSIYQGIRASCLPVEHQGRFIEEDFSLLEGKIQIEGHL